MAVMAFHTIITHGARGPASGLQITPLVQQGHVGHLSDTKYGPGFMVYDVLGSRVSFVNTDFWTKVFFV